MHKNIVLFIISLLLMNFLTHDLYAENTTMDNPETKSSPKTLNELQATIEKIRQDTHTPAIGIALVNKNGPYWVAGLGETNVEDHVKTDENTMFRIASVSKMFVGLSVLKLVEQGKLQLRDKLRDIAPEIAFENPWENTHPILIAHLLEHTTGWDTRPSEYANNAPDTTSLQQGLSDPLRIKARKSRWIPGTRHAYSNTGSVVAGYVVEKITHKKYEDFVQENFFNPLQMDSTTFFKTDKYLQHAATLYVNNRPEKYAQPYSRPASSVNTSAKDIAQLLQLFINQGTINNNIILTSESILKMQTPLTTLGAAQGITSGYGLTMSISGHEDFHVAFYGHAGELPGAVAYFYYAPEIQSGYAFMLNTSNARAAEELSHVIRAYLLKDNIKQQPDPRRLPSKFQHLTGFYVPINPQSDIQRIGVDLIGIMKFSVSDHHLHRQPFLGGWKSNDYAINNNNLIDPWTGLPSIAVVQDPLAGEIVQVQGISYKQVSAFNVYGKLMFLISLVIVSVLNIIFALVWIPRQMRGRVADSSEIRVRSWSLTMSLTLLLLPITPLIFGADILDFSSLTATSISIFLLSIIYPLVSFYSLWVIYNNRAAPMNKWVYWGSTLCTTLNIGAVMYAASYGFIGLRLWA